MPEGWTEVALESPLGIMFEENEQTIGGAGVQVLDLQPAPVPACMCIVHVHVHLTCMYDPILQHAERKTDRLIDYHPFQKYMR